MGLMFPSRKQYDSFTPRVGTYSRPEKIGVRTFATNSNPAGTSGAFSLTMFTVPSGYKATLLSWSIVARGNAGYTILVSLTADGSTHYQTTFDSATFSERQEEDTYEEGVVHYSTATLDVSTLVGASNAVVYVCGTYVLELAGEGFYT